MQTHELNEIITLEQIKMLLIELGAQHIIDHSNDNNKKEDLITNTICHNLNDGDYKLYYYHESKQFHCYTSCGKNYSLYDLVIQVHKNKGTELKFRECISWICLQLGIKQTYYEKPAGFGHEQKGNSELDYYAKFERKREPITELVEHSEQIFVQFSNYHHPSFLDDNINHKAMNKFEIMFDYYRHRIIVPHRKHDNGALIGIKTRSLNQWEVDAGFKYVPLKEGETLYSYPTYANLYGYYQNLEAIKRLKKIILFEAEKSVLQCETYYGDDNVAVALCGSNLSPFQVKLILESGVEEVYLALDKENKDSLDEKSILYQQKLLRMGRMMAQYVRVFVIYDDNGLLELKDSPSDQGQEVLETLLNQRKEIYTLSI